MSQNGQTHFKNLAAFTARFLKSVWQFWDIMHETVKAAIDVSRKEEFWNLLCLGANNLSRRNPLGN